MNQSIQTGKKRTILISISILLVSIHTIYYYHVTRPNIDTAKLGQQIIRFLLTGGLLFALYKGKNWARIISLVLFSIATLTALIAILTSHSVLIYKTPLIVMTIVYSFAIYHFGFSKEYKHFINYQQLD